MKVNEIFASIQGEGRYVGKPQVFIRLSGCNLRCRWCDTKYAWEGGREMTVGDVMKKVAKFKLKSVCITGGEPMLQVRELRKLVGMLKARGYEIVLQTNGTLYDAEVFRMVDCVSMDMKPPSSGEKSKELLLKRLKAKDQVKVVVADERDLRYARKIIGKSQTEVIIQPKSGKKLGKIARKSHEKIGELAADLNIEALVTVGNLSRYIAKSAKVNGLNNVHMTRDNGEAAKVLKSIIKPNDTILVKGSRGMHMEEICEKLR